MTACQRKLSHCALQRWSPRGTAVQHNMKEQVGSMQKEEGATQPFSQSRTSLPNPPQSLCFSSANCKYH